MNCFRYLLVLTLDVSSVTKLQLASWTCYFDGNVIVKLSRANVVHIMQVKVCLKLIAVITLLIGTMTDHIYVLCVTSSLLQKLTFQDTVGYARGKI